MPTRGRTSMAEGTANRSSVTPGARQREGRQQHRDDQIIQYLVHTQYHSKMPQLF